MPTILSFHPVSYQLCSSMQQYKKEVIPIEKDDNKSSSLGWI